ncbi:MAG TPA: c-type cytochrome [Longimicrobiales bacterium]|nr:c-type cytochrome [Longimicrobiales bacterium]
MWQTNLKVLIVVIATVTLYTGVASWIPQVESEVPEELTFSGEVTTDELVEAGESLYEGAGGCIACHGSGTRAPNLLTDEAGTGLIGQRCGERVPGQDCKQYLHASMVDPGSYVVEGYQAIMPDARRTLSDAQIWSLVAYLQSQGGEVTVEADDVQESAAEAGPDVGTQIAPGGPPSAGSGTTDPVALMRQHACFACHRLGEEGGPIGPALDDIGALRTPDHIRRSILDPNAETTDGYDAVAGTMPTTFGQQMTAEQLEALVSFLSEQTGGE